VVSELELEPVPTVADLVKISEARAVGWTGKGAATYYQITPKGQRMIYEAQARNATKLRGAIDGH
jgi:hypothetical protein